MAVSQAVMDVSKELERAWQQPRAPEQMNVGRVEAWASMLAGGLLAAYGLTRRSRAGAMQALAGGTLLYRGNRRFCPLYAALGISTAGERPKGVKIEKSVTVNRPVDEVYRFWRQLENLPRFMQHLERVEMRPDGRSHWVARSFGDLMLEWDAEITHEQENELIGWHTVRDADIENFGSVRFKPAPGDRGTEVRVTIAYYPPAGAVGAAAGRLLNRMTAQQIKEELRRFKEVMEAGEVPRTEPQPAGGRRSRGQQRWFASIPGLRSVTVH